MPDEPTRYRDRVLADVRALTEGYLAGDRDSFGACRDLMQLLLHLTVLPADQYLSLTFGPNKTIGGILSLRGDAPVRLTDGHYLRLSLSMFLEQTDDGGRLKVRTASYQFQRDMEGHDWVFRYDYLRTPQADYANYEHPGAHLQIRGALAKPEATWRELPRLHFPTRRISIEAVIRTLVVQFNVPCRQPRAVWMDALAESEERFLAVAHRPVSGPRAEMPTSAK